MQLTRLAGLALLLGFSLTALGQDPFPERRDTNDIKALDPAEVNLLFSYYEQDGDNSPVTGGIGTEQLTDFSSRIIVKIPIKERLSLSGEVGFDSYSSASTDNIDRYVSSASSSDTRIYGTFGFEKKPEGKNSSYGLKLGGSNEYDYTSLSVGGHYALISADGNRELNLTGQAFIDRWQLIYPEELRRGGALVPTDQRRSYNLGLTYSQVISRKLQASLSLDGIYMTGLLSTPFHRVYFQEQAQARVELLPDNRLKLPVGMRLNYYVADFLVARLYFRYYWDSWGIQAQTASLELPIKINRFFSVYPFYRYHNQTAADYFLPYKEHTLSEEFYTSDYDLAALDSHTFGMGVRYAPVNGLARIKWPVGKKKGVMLLRGFDLRYAHYQRAPSLKANVVSLGLNFTY
ncbi:MAG: DUF3570 domain-containing protein [Phaeodactylibacter sp.]|nr:DUF3570 domain-containing protein [Phaeodactylibacter sp.]MCB9048719.1 DUF3570 domain-containing protein [Lewinellaceae bacterium]